MRRILERAHGDGRPVHVPAAVVALVVVSAAARGDVIVTSDPGDLRRLADDLGGLRILAV